MMDNLNMLAAWLSALTLGVLGGFAALIRRGRNNNARPEARYVPWEQCQYMHGRVSERLASIESTLKEFIGRFDERTTAIIARLDRESKGGDT